MTGDDYLSIEAVARRAQDGGYLTTGDVSAALINPSDGTYLDLEGLSTMATKAGYIEAAADTYIAVGQLPWDSASVDGGYLDLNTMKKLVSGSGEAYLTIEEAQKVAKVGPVSQPDDLYLTVADACWWMAQNSGVKPATLPPTSRVRSAAEVAAASMRGKVWLSPNGQVLSGKESIQLCHENGYATVTEKGPTLCLTCFIWQVPHSGRDERPCTTTVTLIQRMIRVINWDESTTLHGLRSRCYKTAHHRFGPNASLFVHFLAEIFLHVGLSAFSRYSLHFQ